MRFGYADPPYIEQARRHYGCEEIDHAILIARMEGECDAWALSASSPSLRVILPLCPPDVRIGAWVKPFAIFKPNVNPAYAWEPVIFKGGRKRSRDRATVRDWTAANITLKRGLVGAKPKAFTDWLWELFGAEVGDTLTDYFPGTGAVSNAWEARGGAVELLLESVV